MEVYENLDMWREDLYEFLITDIEFIDPKRVTRLIRDTILYGNTSEVDRHSAAHRPRGLHKINRLTVLPYNWHIALCQ